MQTTKQLSIFLSISLLSSLIITSVSEYNFFIVFLIISLVQLIINFIYKSYIEYRFKIDLEKEILATEQAINNNSITIECGACKKLNNTHVNISYDDNTFECKHCKTVNIVKFSFSTIIKTKIYDKV